MASRATATAAVVVVLFLGHLLSSTLALPSSIKIGGLFDMTDTMQEVAFRFAVDRVNSDRQILPNTRLMAQIERIPPQDSFYAAIQVCKTLDSGVAALFGPESPATASHIQSICDTFEIPHVETRWDYKLRKRDYAVNLYPHPGALSQAFADLIAAMSWKSCVVLYEEPEGLIRLQELLRSDPRKAKIDIVIRQLDPGPGRDYRPLLKDVKNSGETRIILDCKTENLHEILKQAQQVGIMTAYHTYVITDLDMQTVELEDFKYGGTNLTGFRLVDPANPDVQRVVDNWKRGERYFAMSNNGPHHVKPGSVLKLNTTIDPYAISTETALTYDAVHLFAKAITDLDNSQEIEVSSLSCSNTDTWQHGNSLVNYMKMVDMPGLSGSINFDSLGFRTDFNLDIIELKQHGLAKVGIWNRGAGANFTRNFTETMKDIVVSLHNRTLVVTTILAEPYTMYKEDSDALQGNDQFEGYNMDLIAAIADILGFNYSIRLVEDGAHGTYNKEAGTWNGMIGELLSQKADLAVADLTITYEREQGVDFTMPFMNLGITILFTKPTAKDPNIFSFLSPLSLWVWIYMMTAYLAVSLLLYMLARISPYENGVEPTAKMTDEKGSRLARSTDPIYESLFLTGATVPGSHGCIIKANGGAPVQASLKNEDHNDGDRFTLLNSFWFMVASLLQQGIDLLPRAPSTRMVAGVWWFFTLIMISSYTANLAAFLTVERMDSPIQSAEDLSKQHTIKYGCLESGSTRAFFRDSKIDTYSRMWVFMDSDKKNFVSSNAQGVQRVLQEKGKYAYLMESTSVEYVIERECELTQIGGLLDSKGYGIALPPQSPFRTPISSAILQLQEGGKLHILKEKWWKQKKGGGQCKEAKDQSTANELSLRNVGGVFMVLVVGLLLACIIACCERCWKKRLGRKPARSSQLSNCTAETSDGRIQAFNHGHGCAVSENGHLVPPHLDLAPPGNNGLTGSLGHIGPGIRTDPGGGGQFVTSSLSVMDLNQSSCAVPIMKGPSGHALRAAMASPPESAWARPDSSGRFHQEQCPHFHSFDNESPS